MTPEQRLIELEHKLRPQDIPAVHVIEMDAHTTKQDAKKVYEATHEIKPKDMFVYIQILPDYFMHKHADFCRANKKLFKKLLNDGLTIDEILKKYVE